MKSLDVVIVMVYLLAVVYVLYQAWQHLLNSLEDVTTIQFERDSFEQQLTEKNLKGIVDIQFGFDGKYKFDQPKDLSLTIKNQSPLYTIEVDWDRSSITDIGGRSRRMIRLTPDRRLSLYDRQVFSTIAPGKSLREKVTAEDLLKLNPEKGTMDPSAPLFSISPLNAPFMASKAALKISVQIALRLLDMTTALNDARYTAVTCDLAMRKIPKSDLFPWKK